MKKYLVKLILVTIIVILCTSIVKAQLKDKKFLISGNIGWGIGIINPFNIEINTNIKAEVKTYNGGLFFDGSFHKLFFERLGIGVQIGYQQNFRINVDRQKMIGFSIPFNILTKIYIIKGLYIESGIGLSLFLVHTNSGTTKENYFMGNFFLNIPINLGYDITIGKFLLSLGLRSNIGIVKGLKTSVFNKKIHFILSPHIGLGAAF